MDMIRNIFARKKVMLDALETFGFKREGARYIYIQRLTESGFEMAVTVTEKGEVSTVVTDSSFNEPYTLHLTNSAVGSFVGSVRAEYEDLLTQISEKCFELDVFKSEQARELIEYVRITYNDELEYLWEKFPDNAIWRRKDNKKWYGALLTVSKSKLGIKADEIVEIIDLRENPEMIASLVDGEKYFAGWHMNKKNWYTIILDGSVPIDEIKKRIEVSYALAIK